MARKIEKIDKIETIDKQELTLILTEKPQVARDFFAALSEGGSSSSAGSARGQGFLRTEQTLITWTIGHLLELCSPEDYRPEWKSWRLDSLPVLPKQMRYRPIENTKNQLEIIRELVMDKNHHKNQQVTKIVIATDAGREGELIARLVLNYCFRSAEDRAGIKFFRFWTSEALSAAVIKTHMEKLTPLQNFDNLYEAGRLRQIADWIVGMNFTRVATLKLGDLFSIGRVQTAVLSLLVDREMARREFQKKEFWKVKGSFQRETERAGEIATESWEGWLSEKRAGEKVSKGTRRDYEVIIWEDKDKKQAEAKCQDLNAERQRPGSVLSVKASEKFEGPPQLYSLTDLQKDANIYFGMTAQETLQCAQSLYEKHKCLSYPRSDAKVLGESSVDLAKKSLNLMRKGYFELFENTKQHPIEKKYRHVFNDAGLTDHHAIIPLGIYNGRDQSERKLFDLVVRRFIAAFTTDHKILQTILMVEFAQNFFFTQGKRVLDWGWKELYRTLPRDGQRERDIEKFLPDLRAKDAVMAQNFELVKTQTSPPPLYTEALLLTDMSQPARLVEEEALKKIYRGDIGLGTQSTRAQIIETLLQRQYCQRQGKQLHIMPKGEVLISFLRKYLKAGVLTSPTETAGWELLLQELSRGEIIGRVFLEKVVKLVKDGVEELATAEVGSDVWGEWVPERPRAGAQTGKEVGLCPSCGGKVIELPKSYLCENNRDRGKADSAHSENCSFIIWKEIAGKAISERTLGMLLKNKKTGILKGFISKKGQKFDAGIELYCENNQQWRTKFYFGEATK